MKDKIILVLAMIVAAMVVFLAVLGQKYAECLQIKGGDKNTGQSNTMNGAAMAVEDVKQKDAFYNIWVEYPQFGGVLDLSQKIAGTIKDKIDTFKKDAKDNWDARRATAMAQNPVAENPEQPFDFISTWMPSQLNGKFISFAVTTYFFSGGAHGAQEIDTFNYDVQNKKAITIDDFLGTTQDGLAKLARMAAGQIEAQMQSKQIEVDGSIKEMIKQGTKPVADNFKNFTFNQNSVTIYFQQYQMAPGAAGLFAVPLYKSDLESNGIKSDYFQ